MAAAREAAREYFRQGLNCAECVLQAYLDQNETGLQTGNTLPADIIRLASGFGGGIGHTRNMCGAITGALLALGCVKGRDPFALEEPKERVAQLQGEVYPPFAALVREVEGRYGTLICRELTAPQGEFEGRERKKNCQEIIGSCAALAAKYTEE